MDALKGTAAVVFALAAAVALLFAFGWLVREGVDVAIWVLPWLRTAVTITFSLCGAVVLPLAIFRKTRPVSAICLQIASYVFGATLWFFGLLIAYAYWGVVGVFIGLIMFGVGVVPVAALAALLHADWLALGQIALGLALTFGARVLVVLLLAKSGPKPSVEPAPA